MTKYTKAPFRSVALGHPLKFQQDKQAGGIKFAGLNVDEFTKPLQATNDSRQPYSTNLVIEDRPTD